MLWKFRGGWQLWTEGQPGLGPATEAGAEGKSGQLSVKRGPSLPVGGHSLVCETDSSQRRTLMTVIPSTVRLTLDGSPASLDLCPHGHVVW